MTGDELRDMYLDFFKGKGHAVISGSSLMPQNDPTVLFTTAGMHPLVPYLLGEPHPAGARLCNCQKCIRTGDIDSVGDPSHLTFFEMLGNWSLGDYFKEEAIDWSYEFLTSPGFLGLDRGNLWVTVFEGNEAAPRDDESAEIWRKHGIAAERIFALPMEDNWWGPAGRTGPCGPDTEMFMDTGKPVCGSDCRPGCSCGKFFEIWNDVFMQYEKREDGSFAPLKRNNVDTGMGVERTVAMLQGRKTVFETEMFAPLMEEIAALSKTSAAETEQSEKSRRVLADHIRSAVFVLGDEQGISPGNLGQGYVLRRLIRSAVRHARRLGIGDEFTASLADRVIEKYERAYPELSRNRSRIKEELGAEVERFDKTLSRGMAELDKVLEQMRNHGQKVLSGRMAFRLYDTCGFPFEFTRDVCADRGFDVDEKEFDKSFEKHRAISRQGADKAFKGGLVDHSETTTRLHTATHLLHQSLRKVLGEHVQQKGSNITAERLRFDFAHDAKMTQEQIKEVEQMVNDVIVRNLPVTMAVMDIETARESGATALFSGKYGEQVNVYSVGDFSKEVCGGPHVRHTGELGRFRIVKEESSSSGVRRIRAVLE